MTLNEYQVGTMRTAPVQNYRQENDMLLNAVLGISGEGGEVADIVKKALFQGHPLDKEHLIEEVGDCLYYIALAATALGMSLDEIAFRNQEKLRARYPYGFDAERSLHRKKEAKSLSF